MENIIVTLLKMVPYGILMYGLVDNNMALIVIGSCWITEERVLKKIGELESKINRLT